MIEKLDLFHALGEVDDYILEDAEAFLQAPAVRPAPGVRPAPVWVKWGSLAACAAVALTGVFFFRRPSCTLPVAPASVPPAVQTTPGADRPAVEPAEDPEALTSPPVEMNFNELAEEPQTASSMFALMIEDFVPMTRQELLDYYGVALPVEELFPNLSAAGPNEGDGFGRGIYRREGGDIYFDGNLFSFTSADGVQAVQIALDKAFHMPSGPWELPGDELCFTNLNGWELALFRWVDEAGDGYFYTEFRQNGVDFRVTGKNLAEGEFAALLEALLEPRSDFAPGEARTFQGTYGGGIGHQFLTTRNPDGSATVEESWRGPLLLDLDDGGEYATLNIELTPEQAAQFADLDLGGQVTVRFTGEPATVGTVWNQQLVSIERN